MGWRRLAIAAVFFLVSFLCSVVPSFVPHARTSESTSTIQPGDRFPKVHFPNNLTDQESRYLGVFKKKTFSLDDIQGKLILVDYINTNCPNCIRSVPTIIEIYRAVERDPALITKVKVVAIGVGDTLTEIEAFKTNHQIPYPILPDEDYKAHNAVGDPRVPFLVVAKKDPQGKWTVLDTKLGLMGTGEYKSTTYLEEDWIISTMQGDIFSIEEFIRELKVALPAERPKPKPKKPVR